MITFPFQTGRARAALAVPLTALALCACAAPQQPAQRLASNPQVLLLGEVHDNALGHRQRFDELRRRVEAGWRPVVAMEQFDHESQALLSKAQQDCADSECVIKAMQSPRWDWDLYRPVIDLALSYRLPLIAANLSRAEASRTVRDGIKASFDEATIQAYGLTAALPADIREGQQVAIVAGHCNMLPQPVVAGMVEAQVARDIWMAKIIRQQMPRDVVLLAGNGHVRKDIGVGRWINAVEPELVVRSEGYLEQGVSVAAGAYDVTHSIKMQERSDPCADMKPKQAAPVVSQ